MPELCLSLILTQRCRERCLEQCSWGEREGGGWSPSHPCPPLPPPPAPVHPASVLAGFECVFCNFVCKTKNMFERHLQIHLITRMFECDVCHKFMKTPEQLLEHKKCHTVPTGGLK